MDTETLALPTQFDVCGEGVVRGGEFAPCRCDDITDGADELRRLAAKAGQP